MENYTYNGILIVIGFMIIYQSYKLIVEQRKLQKDLDRMKEDFNIEFKGPGGSVSKQRKNYPEQEHQANDDFRYSIEPTSTELHDNIDREERHNVAGGLNRPTEELKRRAKNDK